MKIPHPLLFFCILVLSITSPVFAKMELKFQTSDYHGYNISCFGSKDGSVGVTILSGGTPPYQYAWSNGATTQTILGLTADYYHVTVTDSTGATDEGGINLSSPEAISLELNSPEYQNGFNVSCFHCYNGSITSTVGGGVTPLSFLLE